MSKPKILGVLQNQWFRNPDLARAMIKEGEAKYPGRYRRRMIARFAGCKTGKVLRQVFGDWCEHITWEESSKEIGGHAASMFIPDPVHLKACYEELNPIAVIAFGNVASCALSLLIPHEKLIIAPHPAARGGDIIGRLHAARAMLESYFVP